MALDNLLLGTVRLPSGLRYLDRLDFFASSERHGLSITLTTLATATTPAAAAVTTTLGGATLEQFLAQAPEWNVSCALSWPIA